MDQLGRLWSAHPLLSAVGAVGLLGLLLGLSLVVLRAGRRRSGQARDRGVAGDVGQGGDEAAAERALKAGHLQQAYNLFLRARQPMRAAHVAIQQGRLQDAADLFEKAGHHGRAADLYQQAGMKERADELRAEEERVHRERLAQKEALRQRLASEAGDADDEAEQRLLPPPPAPAGKVAEPPPTNEAELAIATKPAEPSRFGIKALVDRAAAKVESEALALADTQAAMAAPVVPADPPIGSRAGEVEAPGLRYAVDAAVAEARGGPAPAALQAALETQGAEAGDEDTLYQLGLALVAAGRWGEATEAFARIEHISPGYRDVAARAQELLRWQAALGQAEFSLPGPDGQAARFTLLGELGRGRASVVYRARDEHHGRDVALKLIADGTGSDPAARARFESEARQAMVLHHRNIATLYDLGEQDGKVFATMELVEGSTVAQVEARSGPLPPDQAAAIIVQVLDALEFAHGREVLHRDIKPANLMLARDGCVKVVDFGLARCGGGAASSPIDAGSSPYLAPEQLAGRDSDGRADLFAVSVAFYEMVSGHLPFPGSARAESPRPLREIVASVTAALDGVVLRALACERERRFASAAEMARALRLALAAVPATEVGGGLAAGPGSSVHASSPPKPDHDLGDLNPPLAEVEMAPAMLARPARTTPRSPIPAVGPSIGAYRMVRPAGEPDVFTPPPTPRPGSGERPTAGAGRGRTASGEARIATPGPRLSLATKTGLGGPSPATPRPSPATHGGPPPLPPSPTPSPGPGTTPKGTGLGSGWRRPDK